MANDRSREATFQELIDEGSLEIGDGYRAKNDELGGTGPIFLRAGHVSDTHIDFAGVERFHEKMRGRLGQKFAMPGDTIVTTKGNSTGRTSFVTERMPEFVYSPHLSYWRSRNPKVICGGFLRYWSRGSEFNAQLRGMSASTDMAPYLSLTDQRRLRITLPPISCQERIADILGSLDDKIDLNRRMNETLEAMARRLFKSWFVDFDPVHAKAALRREHPKLSNTDLSRRALPNMAPEVAELFPDSFEDSTLGPIPKGWKATTVGEDFSLTMGQSPPGSTYNDIGEGLPFYQGKTDFQTRFPVRRIYCTAPTRYAKRLDTLVSVRAPVGAINMAREDCAIGRGLAAIRHNSGSHSYTYYAMEQQAEAFQHFEAEGTVFGSINKSNFENLSHIAPVGSVVIAFDALVANSDEMIHTVTSETESLASVRDKLLPRLLSGELPVERYTEVCDE
jgi:type I restriction enzyme S subunit